MPYFRTAPRVKTVVILPTKRLAADRSLLALGADILCLLRVPKTVSRLWHDLKDARSQQIANAPLTYDWFVLALDLLASLQTIDLQRGLIRRVQS